MKASTALAGRIEGLRPQEQRRAGDMDHLVPGNVVISVVAHSIAVAPQSYALVARVS
jgi:hypothetical protein